MKSMELAWSVLVAPGSAFAELRERPRFIFPLAVLVISTAGVLAWYYSIVDLPWLLDRIFSATARTAQMSEEQRESAMAMTSRGFMMTTSVLGAAVSIIVLKLLEAAYYSLAGKVTNVDRTFSGWLALAAWTTLPSVLATLAMAIYLLTTNTNQIGNEDLSLLSLNELFFQVPFGGKGFTLLSSLTLLHPWMWWLTAFGVRLWTGRSWTFSAFFTLAPVVVIYGVWAAIAFLR